MRGRNINILMEYKSPYVTPDKYRMNIGIRGLERKEEDCMGRMEEERGGKRRREEGKRKRGRGG